jgi:hypothetical protein
LGTELGGQLDGQPGTEDVLSAGRLMRRDLNGDQLTGFRLRHESLGPPGRGTGPGFAGVQIIAAHPAAEADAVLPYAGPVSPEPADGKLGMRRPEYWATGRSAAPCLSRTLGI